MFAESAIITLRSSPPQSSGLEGAALLEIGLIVNPVAGMGGSVAFRGTDGEAILARARASGAEPLSPQRALRALERLAARAGRVLKIHAPAGAMGADIARQAGFPVAPLDAAPPALTSAADSRNTAAELVGRNVALILFAGGDGTARDILGVVGERVPVLGIPTGVKMQSAVFAVSPEAAGEVVALLAGDPGGRIAFRAAEVMDIDEAALREGRVSARLYGYARIPFERSLVQNPKAAESSEDAVIDALCREVAQEMAPAGLYILGPGTTTARVLHHLGLEGTLLGVDAVLDGAMIGRDLASRALKELVAGWPARLILGIVGGQGFIFGRGNQQIAAPIIRAIGRDNIILLASQRKILGLGENLLRADTGDPAVDAMLAGYIRVRTAPGRSTLMRVTS
ncbi:MAG TPA: ATP-NAD kinase family protein [Stellaceae bacterium]|nr:ATP-NAD kinase family protein [Stellaceae bacterium]